MNSVLSRAPGRRGGRRPGWTLMTTLLILAIASSSALVFTSRVELLKLAVIVALWAAVAAAFVSVIYRRQSDVDQARARDLKLVYDLQLDREISARREYELTVESQLRRELASELRAQAADEVAALRAELSALRTNLEILFDADLSHRPALETDSSARTTVRAYSDWARTGTESVTSRVAPAATPLFPEDPVTQTAENPIIDVPEVRIPTGGIPTPQMPQMPQTPQPEGRRHRRAAEEPPRRSPDETPQPPQAHPAQPAGGRWSQPPQPFIAPEPRREPEPPPPVPQQPRPAAPAASAPAASTPAASTPAWKPVGAEGEWLPPGTPGSNWSAEASADSGRHSAHRRSDETPARHGRHAGPTEAADGSVNGTEPTRPEGEGRRRARSRHAAESAGSHSRPADSVPEPPVSEPSVSESPAPAHASAPTARHSTGAEPGTEAPSTGGQSVADLLARLQPGAGEGRRRRRRED
ncbi:DUF6779 domain-containing protein [Mycolicibacter longobardus]|uniref:DUF6779 domain-containing protein n=1 Tax=Mycolicibacter longobardus TaxID=1108812 RepID=A0A1X1Y9Y4_9MYCO|nr:DUF6779 domain-containing protein [Mycolicibacter longobardus]MCV7385657.1 hypothetical protein [Mycolicibacter longobardus]ORW07917.1 hypothetical protein AWC16_20915 [Mycolicibacter longobardus]